MRFFSAVTKRLFVLVLALACAASALALEPTDQLDWPVTSVSTGHTFTEGPNVSPAGLVYFSDIPNNLILIYNPADKTTSTFQDASQGSNGLLFTPDGNLLACEGGGRSLVIYTNLTDASSRKQVVGTINGKRFNSPNDLTLSDGKILFTDPCYGDRSNIELDKESVYVLEADNAGTYQATRLNFDFVRPNGIATSADGKSVYISDHSGKKLYVWDLSTSAEEPKVDLFAVIDPQRGGVDGMCVDKAGNLYATAPGLSAVVILSPTSKLLGWLPIPEGPANCTLTSDGKTLYVTARKSLYAVKVGELGQ